MRNHVYIPDPIERIESNIENLIDQYEDGVCMSCKKKVDYELVCPSPSGDGPLLCAECYPEGHL